MYLINRTLKKVSDVVPNEWNVYCGKEVATVDSVIFKRWVNDFILLSRTNVGKEQLIILFYDALRAHMYHNVIKKFYAHKIAVFAMPAHKSDCLKNLDVSVFGAFKTISSTRVDNISRRSHFKQLRFARMGGLQVLKSILGVQKGPYQF